MPRMSLAVAPVYGLLVLSAGAVLAVERSAPAVVAAALVLATLAVTALAAVPAHEAVLRERDPGRRAGLHRRLARADLVRLGARPGPRRGRRRARRCGTRRLTWPGAPPTSRNFPGRGGIVVV